MAVNAQIVITMRNQASPGIKQITSDTKALNQVLGGLQSVFAGLGIGVGVQQLVALGRQAADDALQLREAKNALLAVSGSTKTYTDALSTARQQQVLFGGTIKDNIEGLQGLVTISRDSGASLKSLVDLSQRLNVKAPEQGINGARVAIANAFGEGNITSLARRYDIPKEKIAALRDASLSAAEKVKILSDYLDSIGLSSGAVAGKVDADATAFRRLGQEIGDARLKAGDGLATAFAGTATGLSRLIGIYNSNPQAIAEIKALLEGKSGVSQGDIEAQARNLRAGAVGDAQEQARSDRNSATGVPTLPPEVEALKNQLIVTGAASDEARDKIVKLYTVYGQTGDVNTFLAGARAIITAQDRGTKASGDATNALIKLRNEIADSANQSVQDVAKKDLQRAAIELLATKTQQAVDQFLQLHPGIDASKVASIAAAEGYDPQIRKLIEMAVEASNAKAELLKLNNAAAQTKLDKLIKLRAGEDVGPDGKPAGSRSGRGGGSDAEAEGQAFADSLKKQNDEADRVHQSEVALELKRAKTAAERIAILQRELGHTTDIVARNELLGRIEDERNSAAKGHTNELSKQLSLNERNYDSINKQKDALLDIEELTIRDRQQDREDAINRRTAERILNSPNANADAKARASDILALIDVEDRKRAQQIAEKQATVNGQIVNGRILQSRPGSGGTPNVPSGPQTSTSAPAPPAATSGQAGGQQTLMLVLTDAAGAILAKLTSPIIFDDLMGALRQGHMSVGVG